MIKHIYMDEEGDLWALERDDADADLFLPEGHQRDAHVCSFRDEYDDMLFPFVECLQYAVPMDEVIEFFKKEGLDKDLRDNLWEILEKLR